MIRPLVRLTIYSIVWMTIIAVALLVRFLAFSGTPSEARMPLAVAYVVLVILFLTITDAYERRRLILRTFGRGHGTFGYLRNWIKTSNAGLALDTAEGKSPAERELMMFNRFSAALFASMFVVVPLLAA